MPVRAAFAKLVAEKAVTPLPNGTISITLFTREAFDELIQMRLLLEGTAIEMAATGMGEDELARLSGIFIKLCETARQNNAANHFMLRQRFRTTIFSATPSAMLRDLIEHVGIRGGSFTHFYGRKPGARLETILHEKALEALRTGDAKAARRSLARDLRDEARHLVEVAEFADGQGHQNKKPDTDSISAGLQYTSIPCC